MEICCSVKSFAGGTCGFSYRVDRSCISQVVPLSGCWKDISSHMRSCKFSDPENKVDLISSRADIFETPKDLTNCPTHRSNLGVGWSRGSSSRCRVPNKCPAMVKVELSRFQKPIGELASLYHRQNSRRLENSCNLASVSRLLTTVRKITRDVRVKSRLEIGP